MRTPKPETMEVKIGKQKVDATVLGEEGDMIRVQIPNGSTMLVEKPEAPKSTKEEKTTKSPNEEAA